MTSQTPSQITVGGAPEGFDARLVLREMQAQDGPVLFVARDDKRLDAMRARAAFLCARCAGVRVPGLGLSAL